MNHRRTESSSVDAVLLSFDSWDYDASTTASGGVGGPVSLLTSSMSGEDLSLCGKGQTSAFNVKTDSLLRLNVSGSTFCVEPKVFQKLERLPWKTELASPRATTTVLQSNTSARHPRLLRVESPGVAYRDNSGLPANAVRFLYSFPPLARRNGA